MGDAAFAAYARSLRRHAGRGDAGNIDAFGVLARPGHADLAAGAVSFQRHPKKEAAKRKGANAVKRLLPLALLCLLCLTGCAPRQLEEELLVLFQELLFKKV